MQTAGRTLLVLSALALLCGCGGGGNPDAERAARSSARVWLKMIDEGKYDESWEESAAFFRKSVSQEQWKDSMTTFREPLGKNLSRNVKSCSYRTSLPGAPDGQYVIIQFKSSFEDKEKAIETVTPMLDDDGEWRVSGYYTK